MGKVPIRLKEVVYTLSPFQQSVMNGLWKDLPHKAAHHMHNVRGSAEGRACPTHRRRRRAGGGQRRRALLCASLLPHMQLAGGLFASEARSACTSCAASRMQDAARLGCVAATAVDVAPRCAPPPQMRDFVLFCVAPIAGIGYYCADYKEKEKMHHRWGKGLCRCRNTAADARVVVVSYVVHSTASASCCCFPARLCNAP